MVERPLLPFQEQNQLNWHILEMVNYQGTHTVKIHRWKMDDGSYCCAHSPRRAAPGRLRICPWPLAQLVLWRQSHVPEYLIRCWNMIEVSVRVVYPCCHWEATFLNNTSENSFKWSAMANHGEPFQLYLHCLESYNNPCTNQHLGFSDLPSKTSLLLLWWLFLPL